MEHVLGLDLGSANTTMAVVKDRLPVLLTDDASRTTTPALVAWPSEGGVLTGQEARRWRLNDPGRAVGSIRRMLGRDYADPVVKHLTQHLAWTVAAGPSGRACVKLGDALYGPAEVAAELFKALRARAQAAVGQTVKKAVLVVPAHATDPMRLALRLAAQMAGFEVLRMISAPGAVALRVGLGGGLGTPRVLVLSMGAGGADAAVVDVHADMLQVRAALGDPLLGSEVLDRPLYQRLLDRFGQRHGVDLGEDMVASQRLWGAADSAKVHLSDNASVEVRLREMAYTDQGGLDLEDELTRADLQPGVDAAVQAVTALCDRVVAAARVPTQSIGGIVLAGGLARVPAVGQALAQRLDAPIISDAQHDGAAAEGAAFYGQVLLGGDLPGGNAALRLVDVLPQPLVVELDGVRHTLLPAQIPVPAATTRAFTNATDDQHALALRLLEGDSSTPAGECAVGELVVQGLLPGRAGSVRVDVTLEVDADGVVCASAADAETGQRCAQPVRVGVDALEQELVSLRVGRGEIRV